MIYISAADARVDFFRLLDHVAAYEPVGIVGARKNGVLVSEQQWKAIQEKLYLRDASKPADA